MHRLILKPGRDKSLRRRHPWIFSGAVARVEGRPGGGDTVQVLSDSGEALAVAAYSPQSQIRARVWDWQAREIDAGFFHERIAQALQSRKALLTGGAIADALAAIPGTARVWERSDADVRALEGLRQQSGLLRGEPPSQPLLVMEHGLRFGVGVELGHKTGYYLDQRDNRLRLRGMARDCEVLDCFSYSGGFALNAAAGGARSVTAIDSSGPALEQARANAELNALPGVEWVEGDVFQLLRGFRDQGRRFDCIVLDPPKYAPTAAHAEKAARAYKDINLLAFKLLRAGGALMTFSCSGGVSAELFQKIVAGAALDAGVGARVEAWLHAAADHPVALNFPESEYLKGLLCRL